MLDGIYLESMKDLIAEYNRFVVNLGAKGDNLIELWDKFLVDHGAMTKDGGIISEYPKVVINKANGEHEIMDCGGVLGRCMNLVDEIKQGHKEAHIDYFPKFYSYYLIAKSEINK